MWMTENEREKRMKKGGREKYSDLILGIPRSKLCYTISCIEIIGMNRSLWIGAGHV